MTRAEICRCGHGRNVHDEAGYGICEFDGACDCVKFERAAYKVTPGGQTVLAVVHEYGRARARNRSVPRLMRDGLVAPIPQGMGPAYTSVGPTLLGERVYAVISRGDVSRDSRGTASVRLGPESDAS